MTRIEEGDLLFEFGDKWRVLKLDEHPDYRNKISKINKTKAVDFLAIFNNQTLYFIEVKDFRRSFIENKDRLLKGKLAIELAQKVRDSIACIIGSYRTSNTPENWDLYAKLLCHQKKQIKVVLWLELDLPNNPSMTQKFMASINTNKFKKKLTWLTYKVLVCNTKKQALPDVKVRNLPR
ncbi:hypothetical protein [Candidatus Marithrix sp. Canyon 246]|uniref:hypothetical protein n=1 Tax=Candidatus Marithrix sp. Canyon 246 TaxID=1827136 RepID=UPI00084A08E1|nr:hypothetical protein [Candidatus Marithrix sp. Canyon 246]